MSPRRLVTLALVLALGASACSSDSDESGGIVSLSATATEILFAIGAGDDVVAVDDQSNFPPEAPMTDLSGFTPNIEAIAGFEPDLVVVSNDTDDLVSGLEELGVEVLVQPSAEDVDDSYSQIRELGEATGREDEAEALVERIEEDIEQVVADAPEFDEAPTYYHELDENFFTATSATFIGRVYSLLGLENIADDAEDSAGGFPQLSAEFILEADPDFVFLADTKCCNQSAETVADRDGWEGMTAVVEDQVVELDDDIASRWGPRIVDFLRTVADAVGDSVGDAAA